MQEKDTFFYWISSQSECLSLHQEQVVHETGRFPQKTKPQAVKEYFGGEFSPYGKKRDLRKSPLASSSLKFALL